MAEFYPLPSFSFTAEHGEAKYNCTEISGLSLDNKVIEYRGGSDKEYHKSKQPGLFEYGNVTLKRGTFTTTSKEFYEKWWKTVYFQEEGEKFRGDLTISLLNEKGEPAATWVCQGAYATKVSPTTLKSDGNEVAIESIEFVVEKVIMK
ncbi:phage tail protein [Tenacibaculum amylolyticum]|uniref:phage tail protein n=1 Tax=Tenacibaculum amylolyticum TaxID=104269 RepID=UPI003892E3E2